MKITDTPSEAFDRVQMDIVGILPATSLGNKYILTIQDNLTKYSLAIPLISTETASVANAFVEEFICRFGCPKEIMTDQGSNFQSKLMKKFANLFKINQVRSTAFHPQTMGSIERSHHSLAEYLKQYVVKNDWDIWLKYAMFSYNTSVHEATQFSPHELIFGRKARIPSEFSKETIDITYDIYVDQLTNRLRECQNKAGENLNIAKENSKKFYDRKLNSQNFEINEEVYLLKEPKVGKFSDQYSGPFKIMRLFENNLNAELDLGKGKTKIVHLNKLKHAFLRLDA